MALHGLGGINAHHGCLRGLLVLGGLTLIVLALLGVTNTIPLVVTAFFSALFSLASIGLAINIMHSVRSIPPSPTHERLLHDTAKVIVALAPEGRVLIQGENWAASLDDAFADQPMAVGERVRVIQVENLRLIVTPTVEALVAHAQGLPRNPSPNVQ